MNLNPFSIAQDIRLAQAFDNEQTQRDKLEKRIADLERDVIALQLAVNSLMNKE